ncbi:hypothetical protein AB6N24_08895 [Cellulomonas sp. 179-A 4D5 NHS]|uniref:hypothetical protein n=1 Tax=Cellulomonas sp. 179-A 4D5 NHS TaxID=3142378 RepID=UPI0039A352CF
MVFFDSLSPAQAAQFCEHVVAREPYLLRELASWLEQTGGPLEAMDASVDSLVPLWEWYLNLAGEGFLGLTDGLVPSSVPSLAAPDPGDHAAEQARRGWVVADRLVHYARLVLTRLVPGAYWGVCHDPGVSNYHQVPSVFLPGWPDPARPGGDWPSVYFHVVGTFAVVDVKYNEIQRDRLRKIVLQFCPERLPVPARQDPHPSVLRPYLTMDLPPIPDIARVTPALAWLNEPSSAPEPPADTAFSEEDDWEDLVLAKGPVLGLEDEPGLLTPLPADRVAAALTAGGFTDLDAPALMGGAEFEHPDDVAQVATLVHDGALRAVYIEPINPSRESWERLIAPLQMLAGKLGANLVPQNEYPD